MSTRTCKKCGWVVSDNDPVKACPVCHTKYEKKKRTDTPGICKRCGKPYEPWSKYKRQNYCLPCYQIVYNKIDRDNRLYQRRRDIYNEWLKKIAQVPKDYPTLTEKQWMEAVKHFGKCAICGDESIDTRGLYIPFKSGGRYCDWNVIPICSKCAQKAKSNYNYFLYDRPPGLIGIIDYLEPRLEAAIQKGKEEDAHTE